MRGYIREIAVEFPEDSGGSTVTTKVQDDSLFLDRTHKRRAWGVPNKTTDGLIATQIMGEANLVANGLPAQGQKDLEATQDETDAAFLKKRAAANGFEVIYRRGMVYFGPRRLSAAAQPNIRIDAGPDSNCIFFNINDNGYKPDAVPFEVAAQESDTVTSRTLTPDLDPLGPEPASSVEVLDDGFVWKISKEGESSESNAQILAQEKANENAMKASATGALDGARYGHVLLTGLPVGVDGVGSRDAGKWYVDKVKHVFDINGYRQDFELLRNAYGDNLETSNNPLAGLV